MLRLAFIEMGMTPDVFWNCSFGEFVMLSQNYENERLREKANLRLILAAQTGQDPRKIFEMPGDWDHLKVHTKEDINNMAKAFGKEEWQV